jgi:hypothetical protein
LRKHGVFSPTCANGYAHAGDVGIDALKLLQEDIDLKEITVISSQPIKQMKILPRHSGTGHLISLPNHRYK